MLSSATAVNDAVSAILSHARGDEVKAEEIVDAQTRTLLVIRGSRQGGPSHCAMTTAAPYAHAHRLRKQI